MPQLKNYFALSLVLVLLKSSLALLNDAEKYVIDACLERYGGLTYENAKRLERYTEWSNVYEEIPCFTNCYLSRMFDFYNETHGFNHENVIKKFGEPIYNACKQHLGQRSTSVDDLEIYDNYCERAYNGFHCIVNFENDPFIFIESMTNVTLEAKSAMKHCLVQFDEKNWPRIKEYAAFPIIEPIPCFTQCFTGQLQLYNRGTHRWNLLNMHTALGVPKLHALVSRCHQMRGRNQCLNVYRQFTCFVLAN